MSRLKRETHSHANVLSNQGTLHVDKGLGHLLRDAAHSVSALPARFSESPVSMASCLTVLPTLLQLLVSWLKRGTAMTMS